MATYAESTQSGRPPVYDYQRPEYGSDATRDLERPQSAEERAKLEEAIMKLNNWHALTR